MPSEVNRLSNREDYLDSLLKSVAGPEEKERKSMLSTSFEDSLAAGINPEDDFLMKYDQEFFDLDEDDFLKEFESGLGEEKAAAVGDAFDFGMDSSVGSKAEEVHGDFGQDFDSMEINTMDQSDMPSMDYDSILASAGDSLFDGGIGADALGNVDTFSDSASGGSADADVDAILKAALGTSDMEELEAMGMDEEKDGGFGAEGTDAELLDILSGMSDDSDLADIGNMLRAHDEDELLEGDGLDDFGDELSENLEEAADSEQEATGKKKRGKKKKADPKKKDEQKKKGVLSKLSAMFFGEDDDIDVPEASEMGNISDENMQVLKDMEKAEKKKQKKEKKAQKKKEKKEKRLLKEANAKPKKEKKPKAPKEPPVKTKPLPKGPVFLIFLMGASIVVLIYLGSSYVGYTSGIAQAEEKYDNGEYVEAYHLLQGMEIKEIDKKFYDKARLTAYLQKEMDAYEAYTAKEMYPEALNALLCAVGKYDKYIAEASGIGADVEFDKILEQAVTLLSEVYNVTVEEAEEVYQLQERDEYTTRLYELLERAGYTE